MGIRRLAVIGRALMLFAGFAAAPSAAQQAGPVDPSMWSREEKEQFLLTARIVRQKEAPDGVTLSRRATLQDDRGTHDAHIQTIDEQKARFEGSMGTEINFRDTYKFNLAAYLLDRILDLNMIPVTVERKVGGQPASVTWWVDNMLMTEKERMRKKANAPPGLASVRHAQQMYIMNVFDQLIKNTDRNIGNILITRNWNIWMIDHTRAFRVHHDLPEPKKLVMCDRVLLQALRDLQKETLTGKLGKYLTVLEIDGLLARRDKIVKFFDDKVAQKGEDDILFDYLIYRRPAQHGLLD